jgi:hypothetical protein
MAAEVVEGDTGVDVVGRIDVDLAVEDVGRGIGGVDVGYLRAYRFILSVFFV